ncbi:multidrug efflux SMR transporter [Paenibacillus sp. J5C_2022]|uniref:DMT family transporter n=1 Tax=Paenibacillus sp. J5C2022 TaxID=2977129 RepID=UPI0021D0F511|nr:multidrug efflux SMR transporter [Paenibacillus sp. J5C2022]MCU6709267.1 multidrug efflux SMR transporter [Paenibacillus sp. J5C2022]
MRRAVLFLTCAIVFETFGTTMLKLSEGFTNVWPSLGVAVGFLISFTSLSLALRKIPLSVAYATWSAAGTALTAIIGFMLFSEQLDAVKGGALGLIIVGIIIMNMSHSNDQSKGNTAVKLSSKG